MSRGSLAYARTCYLHPIGNYNYMRRSPLNLSRETNSTRGDNSRSSVLHTSTADLRESLRISLARRKASRSNVPLRLALFPRTRTSSRCPGIRSDHPLSFSASTGYKRRTTDRFDGRLAANLQRNDARLTMGRYRDNMREREEGRERERERWNP